MKAYMKPKHDEYNYLINQRNVLSHICKWQHYQQFLKHTKESNKTKDD